LAFELARPQDAVALADISRRAFETDVDYGAPGSGGPPGYDSAGWQAQLMRQASAYWKIMLDGQLIGGAIVFSYPRGRYYLARIFLDPACQGRGIGTQTMGELLALYPEARVWTLETPSWNRRTKAFYRKLGFQVARETDRDVYFRKVIAVHEA
jgi:ribosomal protein S18 acetylase RimI-like enzyme